MHTVVKRMNSGRVWCLSKDIFLILNAPLAHDMDCAGGEQRHCINGGKGYEGSACGSSGVFII